VTITNFGEDELLEVDAINNPEDAEAGSRKVPFSNRILIDRADFMENPPKKFFRLSPGGEVRLRYSFVLKCEGVEKDAEGRIIGLTATVDRDTLGKQPEGRKVKGVIHWVSASHAISAEIRLYDRLFSVPQPGFEGDPIADLNPESLTVVDGFLEPALGDLQDGERVQFERTGYFVRDAESTGSSPVFNRTVTLKDSWGKK